MMRTLPTFRTPLPRRAAALALAAAATLLAAQPEDEPRLSLTAVQDAFSMTTRVERADDVCISDGRMRLRFFPGQRRAEANDRTVWLNAPFMPSRASNDWSIGTVDLEALVAPVLAPTNGMRSTLRVMLDAGHGGVDSGASTTDGSLTEKDLTLDIVRRTGRLLAECGMEVGFTRDDDVFLSLSERGATAAVWRAQALVSVHLNFAHNRDARGNETYVLPAAGYPATAAEQRVSMRPCSGNTNDLLNALLGYAIHRHLPGRTRSGDRGLRRARYQVLRQAPCPAVLVECGFLSNEADADLLAGGWYRDRVSRAIAAGILDYAARLPHWTYTADPPLAAVQTATVTGVVALDPAAASEQIDFVGPPWPPSATDGPYGASVRPPPPPPGA